MHSRRTFIRNAGLATASLTASRTFGPFYSYAGTPSEKLVIGVAGTNNRGMHLAGIFAKLPNIEVAYIVDPDQQVLEKTISEIEKITSKRPKGYADIRKMLEIKSVDALVAAPPDHWHAPMAMMAVAAGKHVYIEKPVSHNPAEGEMLVQAAKKYNKLVQVGMQRRSFPGVNQMVKELKEGIIGRVYFARAWYANNRKSIGYGKPIPVPSYLNWELWQGPAPRRAFHDNYVPYNWHWFWHWGTDEALNNGTHEVDLARWVLGVDYPEKVTSSGGRFQWKDDWETPDTQTIDFQFANHTALSWESRSCNSFKYFDSARGVVFFGEQGTVVYGGGDGYKVYGYDEKLIKEVKEGQALDLTNTVSATAGLDVLHIRNFVDSVRGESKLTAPVEEGHKSTLLCQLGNMAFRTGKTIYCNPSNGKPTDTEAAKLWKREYEKGWEPVF